MLLQRHKIYIRYSTFIIFKILFLFYTTFFLSRTVMAKRNIGLEQNSKKKLYLLDFIWAFVNVRGEMKGFHLVSLI